MRKLRLASMMLRFLVVALVGLAWSSASAEEVYQTPTRGGAHEKVYVVKYKGQADACVYVTKHRSQARRGKPYIWYFVKSPGQATRKIYFVKTPGQADRKVYFVKTPGQAGPC